MAQHTPTQHTPTHASHRRNVGILLSVHLGCRFLDAERAFRYVSHETYDVSRLTIVQEHMLCYLSLLSGRRTAILQGVTGG